MFRLATLLQVRTAERQQKRAELAQAYQAEEVLQQQARQLVSEQEAMRRTARRAAEPGRISVDALVAAHRYELLLETQLGTLRHQVSQVHQEIERRRAALVEADQQVKVLEKLRDKQHEAHHREMSKLEIKELDEIAGQSAWRERR